MLSTRLLEVLSRRHLLKHPFYRAWMRGELSRSSLRNYAAQYDPHVRAFPRYVSAVHSLCPDESIRRSLARNLSEEEGLDSMGEPHPELWLRFAEGLGASRAEILGTAPRAAAAKLRDGFFDLCRSSYAEGLGALFAYEYQVPEIARTKIEGLETHYGIRDAKTLRFFNVHEEADRWHSEECRNALDLLDPADQGRATKAAVQASELLWDFLSEAHAYA